MQPYIGTKSVNAAPMSRAAYNLLRGWELPANENGEDSGYLVEYTDGGTPNHDHYTGYISWSPQAQFERAYQETTGLTFGLALAVLKLGGRVQRAGWNGQGMWLSLKRYVEGAEHLVQLSPPDALKIQALPWIGMKTADNYFVPWLASQTDMLADDWCSVTA